MTEDGIIRHYPKRKRNDDVTRVANKNYTNYIKNISVPCSRQKRQSSSSNSSLILEEVEADKENRIEDESKSRASSSSCSSEHNIETEKQKPTVKQKRVERRRRLRRINYILNAKLTPDQGMMIKCFGCHLEFDVKKNYHDHIQRYELCRIENVRRMRQDGANFITPVGLEVCVACGRYTCKGNLHQHVVQPHLKTDCREILKELILEEKCTVDEFLTSSLFGEGGPGGTVIECYGCDVTFTAPKHYSSHISNNRKRCREMQLEFLWKPDCTLATPDNFQYCLGCGQLVYKLHKNMANHLNRSNRLHNGRKCKEVIEELLREKGEDVDQGILHEIFMVTVNQDLRAKVMYFT